MAIITLQPDMQRPSAIGQIETALFLGVRGDPSLESTQLRYQVRLSAGESVQLESGHAFEDLGGALFLTTREPQAETPPGERPAPIGWLRWIADAGRRSFQVQLAISHAGFDRVCGLAQNGRFPHAILTFKDNGSVVAADAREADGLLWNNVASKVALIDEFTLRYDLAAANSAEWAQPGY